MVPVQLLEGLADAAADDLAEIEIIPTALGLTDSGALFLLNMIDVISARRAVGSRHGAIAPLFNVLQIGPPPSDAMTPEAFTVIRGRFNALKGDSHGTVRFIAGFMCRCAADRRGLRHRRSDRARR
ncbi:hypothetical protein [Rhodomicrobium sp.]|uniref:hypothetical protein n=1 Tax=Rhodomicrobium sp. TaxID=2720632 RepID=UPI0039E4640F